MRYARVVVSEFKPGTIDALNRKAEETLVPQLRQLPGFVSYQAAKVEDRILIAFNVFETREAADQALRLGKDWLKQYAKDALVSSQVHIGGLTIDTSVLPTEAYPVV